MTLSRAALGVCLVVVSLFVTGAHAQLPILESITASGGCGIGPTGITDCPTSGAGVTLTFKGKNFGFFGAQVSAVCIDAPVHVWPRATEELRCSLRASPGGFPSTLSVTVRTTAGMSNALTLAYGAGSTGPQLKPILHFITSGTPGSQGGCVQAGNSLIHCPTGGGITITFTGERFGASLASAFDVCVVPPPGGAAMTWQDPAGTKATCTLKPGVANTVVGVTVSTPQGQSNSLTLSYGSGTGTGTGQNTDCSNGVKDGTEIGIDCGGLCAPCTDPCNNGLRDGLEAGIDCGGLCAKQCGAVNRPTCSDGIKNGFEQGVDCGGFCPKRCDVLGVLCNNGVKDVGEEGIDCGTVCGRSCTIDGNCVTVAGGGLLDVNREYIEVTPESGYVGIYKSRTNPELQVSLRLTLNANLGEPNVWQLHQAQNRLYHSTVPGVNGIASPYAMSGRGIWPVPTVTRTLCTFLPPTCQDGIQNSDETDIDCGGRTCPACAAPTCGDGRKNGDELETDCGGSCPKCTTCGNQIQDGQEEGVDCGGPDCPPCRSTCVSASGAGTSRVNQEYKDVGPEGDAYRVFRGKVYTDFEVRISTSTAFGIPNTWQVWSLENQRMLYQAKNQGEGDAMLTGDWLIMSAFAKWPPPQFKTVACSASFPTTCFNKIKDGIETGVDCGGFCAPCAGVESCSDGIQNGLEAGIDCGGICPNRCPIVIPENCLQLTNTGVAQANQVYAEANPSGDFSGRFRGVTAANWEFTITPTAATNAPNRWQLWRDQDIMYQALATGLQAITGLYIPVHTTATWPPPTITKVTCPPAALPSCSDNTQNGLETGVDCGGPACPPCVVASPTAPLITSITASGGCLTLGTSLNHCPESGEGVTLTIEGKNFGWWGATSTVCSGRATHVSTDVVKCPLKPGKGVVTATLTTWPNAEVSNGLPLSYDNNASNFGDCFDGIKNGFEEGIDCGGLCDEKCPVVVLNKPPVVQNRVPDQVITVLQPYEFDFVAKRVFSDPDGDQLTLRVSGLAPDLGVRFDPFRNVLKGTPLKTGVFLLQVIASDGRGGEAHDAFTMTINANAGGVTAPATCSDGIQNGIEDGVDCGGWCSPCGSTVNLPPTALRIPDQVARLNQVFVLELRPFFTDPNQDPLSFRVTGLPADGTIAYYAANRNIWGIPRTPGAHIVTVFASDGRGGNIAASFRLTVA